MGKFPFKKRTVGYIVFFITGICLIVLIDYLGFFLKFDSNIYDLFTRLKGPVKTDERIVIAAIDEKTLKQFGRWPIDRNHYAELLAETKEAGVVGLDIILAEPSNEDSKLSSAIKKHGRVVLPVYLNYCMEPIYPLQIFTPRKTGHIHAEPGIDGVVREVCHTIYYENILIPSFTSAIYETFTSEKFNRDVLPPAITKSRQDKEVLRADRMLINYYGPPATFPYISMVDIIDGKYPDSYFRNKIVLLGLTTPGLIDRKFTPFTQQRDSTPGVEIHANILNNLLAHSHIRVISPWPKYLCGFLISLLFFIIFVKTSEKVSVFLLITKFLIISVFTFLVLTRLDFWTEPLFFYISAGFAFATTYIYRLDEAARELDVKYSSIVALPVMNKVAVPGYRQGKGLLSLLSTGGINSRIQKLIIIEDTYQEKLQGLIDEKTSELSDALIMIKTMSNEAVLRLATATESKDTYTGKHLLRIRLFVKRLSEFLGMPGDFVEKITSASAMHDVGKIGVPDKILLKQGTLTPEEFEIMKTHTVIGEKILSGSVHPMIKMAASIARYHHEKWDGSGYPEGLKGMEIPIEARILTICDVYESLRSKRPYKGPFTHNNAFLIITQGDDKTSPESFDPDVLRAFIKVHRSFEEIFAKDPN
jgi:HD-GYP domain-containing protein (c-di-GMP phosphodiesterase class II)/CHASE2 domain-containing sensor protein